MKKKRTIQFGLLLIGAFASVFLVVFAQAYRERILPGVKIGAIAVGGLTQDEARARVERTLAKQRADLRYQQLRWQPSYEELGVTFDVPRAVREAFAVGRRSGLLQFFRTIALRQPVTLSFSWGEDVFAEYVKGVTEDLGNPPRDAFVRVARGAFEVVPEAEGYAADPLELQELLAGRLAFAEPRPITLHPKLTQPEVTAEDLRSPLEQAESLVRHPFTVKSGEKTITVGRDDLATWLAFQPTKRAISSLGAVAVAKKVKLELRDEAVSSFLEKLAPEFNAAPEPERILKSLNKVEVLHEGKAGRRLVIAEVVSLLRHHLLLSGETELELLMVEVPAPIEYETAPAAPIPTGKVISVDLTKMLEYLYENGELVYTSKISPGINDWTPTGTFKVYAKTKKQKMSGPGYYLPNVPNILWFKGDYSIHGVYWHNDFGIRPRSHGCIGEPLVEAEWVFNWAEVGTPVVIYKS